MLEKPKYIKTKRLLLRPIEIDDTHIVQKYSLDKEWHRFLEFHTKESVKDFVQKAVNSPWSEHARFSILYKEKMIGSIGLYLELKEKRAEIGYSLSKEYWGLGIIPEAVERIFEYGFNEINLEKIFAQTDTRNLPSQSVMKKLNMKQEGVFRKHTIAQNQRRDIVYFSILRDEWNKIKEKK